jgi:hypothetical protein
MRDLATSVSGHYTSSAGGGNANANAQPPPTGAATGGGGGERRQPAAEMAVDGGDGAPSVTTTGADADASPSSPPTFEIVAPENSRRGMHLGLLIALAASWTQGRGGLLPTTTTEGGKGAGDGDDDDGAAGDSALSSFLDAEVGLYKLNSVYP